MRLRGILGLAAVLLLVACGSASPSNAPAASTSPVVAPSVAASPAAAPSASAAPVIYVGGDRPAAVIVPPGYDPAKPAPLLVLLHGYSSSGKEHDEYFHMGDLAAQRGYLYIHPDGTRDDSENRFWNATGACCDFDHKGIDDVAYLSGLIDEIAAKYAVDPKRIYLVGHSNGGFMSHAMACARPETIAGIVSLAGATFADPHDCAATAPVAVVQVHGTADDTILYDGGQSVLSSGAMDPYPGAIATVASWAEIDGCDPSPTTLDDRLDLEVDSGGTEDPAESIVQRWIGCKPGGAAELWTIPNGSHGPELSDGFGKAVLDFFDAHSKP